MLWSLKHIGSYRHLKMILAEYLGPAEFSINLEKLDSETTGFCGGLSKRPKSLAHPPIIGSLGQGHFSNHSFVIIDEFLKSHSNMSEEVVPSEKYVGGKCGLLGKAMMRTGLFRLD